ncbi:hypothetical protein [Microbacterium sp. AK031]|uniref:hypothetical protein n=1 Tax=Microbacterium sp. AK031 TaxID=2723076 RepID=UPI00216741A7|nr:hypothetical protein [Microbacterium sp. AK031]MCS3843773.1 hypothetical protein [Microbacterium sp. AK031]
MDDHRPDPAEERHPDKPAAQDEGASLGGDETTEEQLDADNQVEEDALQALNPDDSPA